MGQHRGGRLAGTSKVFWFDEIAANAVDVKRFQV
jgi:hypothetical protein